jgi:Flp pilus assembly protein CpaB
MAIVDGASVTTSKVPADKAPEGYYSSPVSVVGKLLCMPIVEGQAFTKACLATEGSGAHLASALADGMRAVTLSLSTDRAGLLYPGCVVDVLVSFTVPSEKDKQQAEAVSMTLLQGVEVLAIDDRSITTDVEDTSEPEIRTHSRQRMVTLMVNSGQAKALQLAVKYGVVSLALRNPLDGDRVDTQTTLLSQLSDEYSGLLARLAAAHAPAGQPPSLAELTRLAEGGDVPPIEPAAEGHPMAPPEPAAEVYPMAPPGPPRLWETVVMRGGMIEIKPFPMPLP